MIYKVIPIEDDETGVTIKWALLESFLGSNTRFITVKEFDNENDAQKMKEEIENKS